MRCAQTFLRVEATRPMQRRCAPIEEPSYHFDPLIKVMTIKPK
jgi:hypothetical protein